MSVNEQMVQDIVKEVVAKLQLQETSVQHGVFADMNEAIEAAKKFKEKMYNEYLDIFKFKSFSTRPLPSQPPSSPP